MTKLIISTGSFLAINFTKHWYRHSHTERPEKTELLQKIEFLRQELELGHKVSYQKGEYKTGHLMPRVKGFFGYLGFGGYGFVSVHALYPDRAIKRSEKHLYHGEPDPETEWLIGKLLSQNNECPHFPKFYGIAIKIAQETQSKKTRIMMEKIPGKTLHALREMISESTEILTLLEQAEQSCIHLYQKNILAVEDVHSRNVMLDQTQSPPRLVLIDFGYWEIDTQKRRTSLYSLQNTLKTGQHLTHHILHLYSQEINIEKLLSSYSDDWFYRSYSSLTAEFFESSQERNVWMIRHFFNTVKGEFEQLSTLAEKSKYLNLTDLNFGSS